MRLLALPLFFAGGGLLALLHLDRQSALALTLPAARWQPPAGDGCSGAVAMAAALVGANPGLPT